MSGRFITFEGIEGVGKSTQIEHAREYLGTKGVDVLVTREPGGTPLAEGVRDLLLDPRHRGMAPDAELLLVFAARAQHLAEVILPSLAVGRWVLCDRFTDATYAYQGGGRGLGPERIAVIEHWLLGTLQPDVTVLLDAPLNVGLGRARARPGAGDRFEQEQDAFFARVRDAYLARARAFPKRFVVVDASLDAAGVAAQVSAALASMLAGAR